MQGVGGRDSTSGHLGREEHLGRSYLVGGEAVHWQVLSFHNWELDNIVVVIYSLNNTVVESVDSSILETLDIIVFESLDNIIVEGLDNIVIQDLNNVVIERLDIFIIKCMDNIVSGTFDNIVTNRNIGRYFFTMTNPDAAHDLIAVDIFQEPGDVCCLVQNIAGGLYLSLVLVLLRNSGFSCFEISR